MNKILLTTRVAASLSLMFCTVACSERKPAPTKVPSPTASPSAQAAKPPAATVAALNPATPPAKPLKVGQPAVAPDLAPPADDRAKIKGEPAGPKGPPKHLDDEILSAARGVVSCQAVTAEDCPHVRTLQNHYDSIFASKKVQPGAADKAWRSLAHAITHEREGAVRYVAAVFAKKRVPSAMLRDEELGTALLTALKRESRKDHTAEYIGEIVAHWWQQPHPALHKELAAFAVDDSHGVPEARAGLLRIGGRYAKQHPGLAKALITVAKASKDKVVVRRAATQHLAALSRHQTGNEAINALKTITSEHPSMVVVDAYAGLGDAGVIAAWPGLVKRWRANVIDPLLGAAMAKATWRYTVATYKDAGAGRRHIKVVYKLAVAMLSDIAVPAEHRVWAIHAVRDSGQASAAVELKKVLNGGDEVLAAAAKSALAVLAKRKTVGNTKR
ncbi:MAG: hypothetical protein KC502_20690 [Myxococcales bacterium]|nr:hypothetical protein [Myxococcales bacterium]